MDSGVPTGADAGRSAVDGGWPDAGGIDDAGLNDGGEGVDAGSESDAGELKDAGEASDAGDPMEGVDGGSMGGDAGGGDLSDGGTWGQVAYDGGPPYPACVGTAWPLGQPTHVPEGTAVTYPRYPPASGNHWPCWAPWTTSSRVLPPERYLHNLEHGGIALLYRCDPPPGGFAADAFSNGASPCPTEAAAVQQFLATAPTDATGRGRYVVSAAPGLPTRFAAISWGWSLESDVLDPAAFACFCAAHLAQGPEPVAVEPPPSSCAHVYPP